MGILVLIFSLSYWAWDKTGFVVYKNDVTSLVHDEGTLQVYFCPREACEEKQVELLTSAQESIHCALYDIGLPSVQQTLLEKSQKMDVRVVTDSDYLKKFNHSFVHADTSGLMHNKFCIVDGRKLSAGSMNPTNNDAHKNNNNFILVESEVAARNYEAEFQELWSGVFKKGDPVANPKIMLGEIPIETYFCPEDHCAARVKEELKKATISIYFMTFSFTHEGIADILLLKHIDGIAISGVMETRQISQYSVFSLLEYQGIPVRQDGNKNNLHHKVFIIDNETVITGSFNPTDGGDRRNDENLMIIRDKSIAAQFLQEFKYVWKEAEE